MDNINNEQEGIARVEKVSLCEIEQLTIPQQVDEFFEEKKQSELTNALQKIEGNDVDFYQELSQEFEKMKNNDPNGEVTKIVGSALDFAEFVKENGNDKLYLDYRDFNVIEKYLKIANQEFLAGEINASNLDSVILMFVNYIKGIRLACQTVYTHEEFEGIENVVKEIITNGKLDLINFLKGQ